MNLIEVMERFPDQESCIDHLERIRWRGTPVCPKCGSITVKCKKEYGEGRVGRLNCHDCNASFKVRTYAASIFSVGDLSCSRRYSESIPCLT